MTRPTRSSRTSSCHSRPLKPLRLAYAPAQPAVIRTGKQSMALDGLSRRTRSRWSSLREQLSWARLKERPPTLWLGVAKQTIALCLLLILTFSNRCVSSLCPPLRQSPSRLSRLTRFPADSPRRALTPLRLMAPSWSLLERTQAGRWENASRRSSSGPSVSDWACWSMLSWASWVREHSFS